MGRDYVDDHRFYLYRAGGGAEDITRWVRQPQARDVLEALSVELSFQALRHDSYDKYMTWPGIQPGDQLRVVNHGTELFAGVVLSVGLDGSVTANDQGWYLTKSEIVFQAANAAADDAIRRMCAKAGIRAGDLPSLPTRITEVWTGDTPETILQDILAVCSAETGKQYKRRVRGGALSVTELPTQAITAWHKPADNLAPFDVTTAKGPVSGRDSMEALVNSVVLTGGRGDKVMELGRGYNPQSVARYGLLQAVERLSGDEDPAQARQRIRTLLDQGDRLTQERTVEELWGTDEVESGILLRFAPNTFGVAGDLRVTEVVHHYGPSHTMSVTVQDPAVGRAAGSADVIEAG